MIRTMKHISTLLISIILLSSCMRDSLFGEGGMKTLRQVTAELPENPATKAQLHNNGAMTWDANDGIAVFSDVQDIEHFNNKSKNGSASQEFAGNPVSGTEFYAFFPDDGSVTFHPDDRYHLQYDYDPASPVIGTNPTMRIPMIARMASETFKFKQTMGLIHFSIQGEHVIKYLRLRGNDDEALAGRGTIDLQAEKPVFVLDGTNASRELRCQPAEPYAIPEGGKLDIYFPVPPMTFSKGLTLDICYLDKGEEKVLSKETARTIVVMRAGIKNFKVVDLEQLIQERGDDGWSYTESIRGVDLQTDEETVVMPPEAVFVQEDINDNLLSYDPDGGTISFKKDDALTGMDVRVGDVLYSMPVEGKAPEGYILKVTDVREEGNKLVYSVEEAGLADAFDKLETTFSYEPEDITEECFTVWDPLDQPEIEDYLTIRQSAAPLTKGDGSEIKINPLDKDKFKLKIEDDKASLDIVVYDHDNNLKTTIDQVKVQIRIEYAFEDGVFDFDAETCHLSVGWKPSFGVNAAVIYKPEWKQDGGDLEEQKNAKEAMLKMEEKLLGKKLLLASIDLPLPTGVKAVINPSFDVYMFFCLKATGEFEIRAGIEKIPIDFHVENYPNDPISLNKSKSHLNFGPITPFVRAKLDMSFKSKFGIGCGVSVKLPKLLKWLAAKNTKPFVGFFCDYSYNVNGKFTMSNDLLSNTLKTHAELEWYLERETYLEGDARLKGDLLFNFKEYLAKYRSPEGSAHTWDTTYVVEAVHPVAYAIAPEHGGIATPPTVTFRWQVPQPKVSDSNSMEFFGLTYDVYLSDDKKKVEDLDASALVANGLTTMEYSHGLENSIKTWYWKVVTHNAAHHTFESALYKFDSGSDGEIVLNEPLRAYIRDNFGTLGDVVMTESGIIHKTPSNLALLRSQNELCINDPEGKYNIADISYLLAEMPGLTVLDCQNNSIRNLSFPNNPNLTSLVCRNNQLTSIDLSNVPGLASLACSYNSDLTKLDITGCPDLKVLDAEDCMLDSLDLRYHQKLQNLYLAGNNFSRLDISRCATLVRLDVYSQHQELLTLRLQKSQEDAIIKRHFNMVLDYVSLEPVLTEAAKKITSTGAVIPVTILVTNYLPLRGVVYSSIKEEPSFGDSQRFEVETQESAFEVKMENLTPDTEYYVRGFGRNPSNFETAYGNVIRFKTLPDEDAPAITVAPEEYDFKEVKIGNSAEHDFVVTNSGTADLVFTAGISDGPFSVSPGDEITLAPGGEQTLTVRFAPTEVGDARGDITLRSNVPGDPFVFPVFGDGIAATAPDPSYSIPEIVDLGLPSGRKWASFNVGASAPEEYGDYYAWGETEPKADYSWETYKWSNGNEYSLTKYNVDGGRGVADGKRNLGLNDDVAYAKLGGHWRMPTGEEFRELVNGCSSVWTTQNGVYGFLMTSNTNGNSIFFPAAGYYNEYGFSYAGSLGFYWSSSIATGYNCALCFFRFESYRSGLHPSYSRNNGLSIRAVYEEEELPVPEAHVLEAVDMGLSVKWASFNVGASAPEDYGDYYAWGETETKDIYDWETYKWLEGTDYFHGPFTKYNTHSSTGPIDDRTVLEPEDDVAHVKWGGNWRMPTNEEFSELVNNCTKVLTTENSVDGYRFISNINGNSIFLPAAGSRTGNEINSPGYYANYWSSSANYSPFSYELMFRLGSFRGMGSDNRCLGFPVRPVTE